MLRLRALSAAAAMRFVKCPRATTEARHDMLASCGANLVRLRQPWGVWHVGPVPGMPLPVHQQLSMSTGGSGNPAQQLRQAIDGLVVAKVTHESATLSSYTLPAGLEWPGIPSSVLVVRTTVFDPIWNRVKDQHDRQATIIIGNPGIGKSTMLNYFLLLALQSKSHDYVVLDLPLFKYTYYFDVRDRKNDMLLESEFDQEALRTELRNRPNVLRLQDVDGEMTWSIAYGVVTVVASSPDESNYKGMIKLLRPHVRYVPTWTLDELQAFRKANGAAVSLRACDVARRFEAIGGIPRHVFDTKDEYEFYWTLVQKAIVTFDFAQMRAVMEHGDNSHKVMQLVPEGRSFVHRFLSKTIEDLWADARTSHDFAALKKHLLQNLPIASERLSLGSLFERYLFKFALQDRACYRAIRDTTTPLVSPAARPQRFVNPLPAPAILRNGRGLTVEWVEMGKKMTPIPHTCYVPRQVNFPLCDALVFGPAVRRSKKVAWVTAIQSTLRDDHQAAKSAVDEFVRRVKDMFGVDVNDVHLRVVFVRDWWKPVADFKWQEMRAKPNTSMENEDDEKKRKKKKTKTGRPTAAALLWNRTSQYHAYVEEDLLQP